MIIVKTVTSLGGACPFQLEGVTDTGRSVYARYRMGRLRIEIDGETEFMADLGEPTTEADVRDLHSNILGKSKEDVEKAVESHANIAKYHGRPISYDGHLTMQQLRATTEGRFQWPPDDELPDH